MAIPTNNRELYKIYNEGDSLAAFVRDQNLVKNADQHTCYCGSSMTNSTRRRTLKDGTIKLSPVRRCIDTLCCNQLSILKSAFFSYTDILGRPNSKIEIKTILEMV